MSCLETTFLIDLLRGKKEVTALKDELERTEKDLAVTTPSIMELWAGTLLAKVPAKEQEEVKMLLQSLTILPLDEAAAKEAAEIEVELRRRGNPIQPEDVMIAGIARSRGEKLVTRDEDYARIPGLRLLKY